MNSCHVSGKKRNKENVTKGTEVKTVKTFIMLAPVPIASGLSNSKSYPGDFSYF